MKLLLICVLLFIATENGQCTMTEAQVQATGKMLKNVCQPKLKISNAAIEDMHKGAFTEDRDLKCYMECTLRTAQIMKDAQLNYDFLKKQIINLPASISEPALVTTEHCKDAAKSADKCDAAFEFYKCFYDDNPSNFFLP